MTVLTTQRLLLREMGSADLDDLAALLGDEEVMRYYPRPKTRSEAQGWIDWNQRLYREHGFGLWAVTLRSTGEFVGDCGLTVERVDDAEEIEVGYHVRASRLGTGSDEGTSQADSRRCCVRLAWPGSLQVRSRILWPNSWDV